LKRKNRFIFFLSTRKPFDAANASEMRHRTRVTASPVHSQVAILKASSSFGTSVNQILSDCDNKFYFSSENEKQKV